MVAAIQAKWLIQPTASEKRMTGEQSRKLKVGDRVNWDANQNDLGTITEVDWAGVLIKWDNREQQSVLHNDMAMMSSKK